MPAADPPGADNWAKAALRRLDGYQQRHDWVAFPVAVARKYSDDQANQYTTLLAYFAFLAVFPLLLVAVSVLGLALADNPDLQQRVLDSWLAGVPVIGQQLSANIHSLDRSGVALAVGLVTAFIGARGLADAVQNAFNAIWQVPFSRRPGFPASLLRSLALLVVLVLGAAVPGWTAAQAGNDAQPLGTRLLLTSLGLVVGGAVFVLGFRLATAREVQTRQLVLGALVATVAWQVLLEVGGLIVTHYLRGASQVYGAFATVIGLLAWFALQAKITLYAVEMDVVRARRLWPRSLVHPPLTSADERALSSYAKAQTRVAEQEVSVEFSETDPGQAPHGPGHGPAGSR